MAAATILNGSLDTFSVIDILHLVATTPTGGALHVVGDGDATVYCSHGAVTLAVNRQGEGLGDLLVRAGFVTAQEFEWSTGTGNPAEGLAQLLTTKEIDPDRVIGFLRHITEESLFELGQWQQGDFTFEPGATHPMDEAFRYPISELIDAVERRHARWSGLISRLESLDQYVELVPVLPGDDREIMINRVQFRLLGAIDGQQTIRELADHLGDGLFHTCQVLLSLVEADLVQLGVDAPAAPAPARAPTTRARKPAAAASPATRRAEAAQPTQSESAPASTSFPPLSDVPQQLSDANTMVTSTAPPRRTPGGLTDAAPTRAKPNGHANGRSRTGVPTVNLQGGHDGEVPLAAAADKPDRALVLRLLSAVKDLEVSERGER